MSDCEHPVGSRCLVIGPVPKWFNTEVTIESVGFVWNVGQVAHLGDMHLVMQKGTKYNGMVCQLVRVVENDNGTWQGNALPSSYMVPIEKPPVDDVAESMELARKLGNRDLVDA